MGIIAMGIGGNSDYPRDRPLIQVNFEENTNKYLSIDIEFGDIYGRNTDIGVGDYVVNRSAADDYRDSERTEYRDAFKVFDETDSVRMCKCVSERPIKRLAPNLGRK